MTTRGGTIAATRHDLLAAVLQAGAEPADGRELRARKRLLATWVALLWPIGILWGALYLRLGEPGAAAFPLLYSLVSLLGLLGFARTHRYGSFRFLVLAMVLLLPFGVMLALGGFAASSAVVFWGLLAPILALLLADPPAAVRWFVGYLVLLGAASVLQPFFGPGSQLPTDVVRAFYVLNLAGVSTVAIATIHIFVSRNRDLVLHDRAAALMSVTMFALGCIWTAIYVAASQTAAVIVPLAAYSFVSLAGYVLHRRLGRQGVLVVTQLAALLLLPFLVMLLFGGLERSSAVVIWAFACPLLALLLAGPGRATMWFFAFLGLVVLSVYVTADVQTLATPSADVSRWFFAVNLGGVSCVGFAGLYLFVGQRSVVSSFVLPFSDALDALLLRKRSLVDVIGYHIAPELARFVVPFEAHTGHVGTDFVRDLARDGGGAFRRNPDGIGILESLELIAGPTFAPGQVDPLVREFYEHTSRFALSIVPEWDRRMRPAFWLFKRLIAEAIGQANLPFDSAEVRRGLVSYIDTIAFGGGEIVDLRGWVRAYKDSGEAIYVGIYTAMRHEDVGYISVGFPLPRANFTATLLPYNRPDGGVALRSRGTQRPYTGHYISEIADDGSLMVVKLPTLGEDLDVYLDGPELVAKHRFLLGDRLFLTLHYSMSRVLVV